MLIRGYLSRCRADQQGKAGTLQMALISTRPAPVQPLSTALASLRRWSAPTTARVAALRPASAPAASWYACASCLAFTMYAPLRKVTLGVLAPLALWRTDFCRSRARSRLHSLPCPALLTALCPDWRARIADAATTTLPFVLNYEPEPRSTEASIFA